MGGAGNHGDEDTLSISFLRVGSVSLCFPKGAVSMGHSLCGHGTCLSAYMHSHTCTHTCTHMHSHMHSHAVCSPPCCLCHAELSSQVSELQAEVQEAKAERKQLTEDAKRLEEELGEAKEERDSAKKVCFGGAAKWEVSCGWGLVGGVLC